MAKTSSSARSALDAIAVAADAATLAEHAVRSLSGKDAKKVTALVADARALASVDAKSVRKSAEKYEKKADEVIGEILRVTAKAIGRADRRRAEEAPPLAAVPEIAAAIALPAPTLAELTVVELRARARAAGHTGYTRMRKADLVALLS
jgi:hypothetical protein